MTVGGGSTVPSAAVPPHPYDKHWHVHVDGKTYGPYTGHQIRKMVQQSQIVGSDLIFAHGEKASGWQQIANDPVLGALFKNLNVLRSPVASRVAISLRARRWLLAIPLLMAASWIVWPYYAAYDLAVAVRNGDISTLEARVAWDSVRQGLRGDLNAIFLQKLNTAAKNDTKSGAALGTSLAAVLGPVIVDRVVDSYVTPQAIAAVNGANRADDNSSNATGAPSNFNETIQSARRIRLGQIKYAFFSGGPLTFSGQSL